MTSIRLQKWLSDAGVCSRRQGEVYIQTGRVRVNGQRVTALGTKVDPDNDQIEVDGLPVAATKHKIYLALHKPRGFVSSCKHADQNVVIDLIDLPERIFPIGRLDKDSTGLLLMTNDGPLHHHLSHPSFDHEKEYDVTVQQPIDDDMLRKLAQGMPILGSRTRPAQVRRMSGRRFRIVLQEGRNRQIRRMVKEVGHKVKRLHRIRVANIHLGGLPEGAWRHLTPSERDHLLRDLYHPNKASRAVNVRPGHARE
jgi:pseudouridine synthase